jgi:hypothetical protein
MKNYWLDKEATTPKIKPSAANSIPQGNFYYDSEVGNIMPCISILDMYHPRIGNPIFFGREPSIFSPQAASSTRSSSDE